MNGQNASGSGGRPRGALRGNSLEANALAKLMRDWVSQAGLTLDDLRAALTPDHFPNGKVPSRTTLSGRLRGKNLEWTFVQTVADVCFADHKVMDAALGEARTKWDQHLSNPTPVPEGDSKDDSDASMLMQAHQAAIEVQRQLVTAQDALLNIRRSETVAIQQALTAQDKMMIAQDALVKSRKAEADAGQIVLILFQMLSSLNARILELGRQVERSEIAARAVPNQDDARRLLAEAEAQRDRAIAEKERAESKQREALELADKAFREIDRLKEKVSRSSGSYASPGPTPLPSVGTVASDGGSDEFLRDIDEALGKAEDVNDDGDRLTLNARSELDFIIAPFASPMHGDPPRVASTSVLPSSSELPYRIDRIYMPQAGNERDGVKKDALCNEVSLIRLIAHGGASYLLEGANRFRPALLEALDRNVHFEIIISNPWNSIDVFIKRGPRLDVDITPNNIIEIGTGSQYYRETFVPVTDAYEDLRGKYGEAIELRITPMDIPAGTLLTSEAGFYEPYVLIDHEYRASRGMKTFEIRFSRATRLYEESLAGFTTQWELASSLDYFRQNEELYRSRLRSMMQ
ncbi:MULTISPECIES: hypothetical protein [unclassified Streptomyces]|uniref:hypothetical protein n=1 Tax=unclassified Streptomyces TaxID=2593676 RepID=UPI00362D6DED